MKKFNSFILIILSIMVSSTVWAETTITTISENITFNTAGSPYIIQNSITIPKDVKLTIENNVIVKIANGASITVDGELEATGATITSNESSPEKGDWNSLVARGNSSGGLGRIELNSTNLLYGTTVSVTRDLIMNNSSISSFSSHGITINYTYSNVTLNSAKIDNCDNDPIYLNAAGDLSVTGTTDLTGNAIDRVYIRYTSITKYSNTNLPKVNVPYYFYSNVTVNTRDTLTIAPGNILKFSSGAQLIMYGKLIAEGTPINKIIFTSYRDDNFGGDSNGDGIQTGPAVSNWNGVTLSTNKVDTDPLNNIDQTSSLEYCEFWFSGSSYTGGVNVEELQYPAENQIKPTIQNCEFYNNYYGIRMAGKVSPNVTNNTIGSSSMTPIALTLDAAPNFVGNEFSFSDNNYDAIGILNSTVKNNAILSKLSVTNIPNVTYLILGAITVEQGVTFTIDPGLVIKSISSGYINVFGQLVANGTSSEPIIFTSEKDDNVGNPGDTNKDGTITSPTVGDWRGIRLVSDNDADTSAFNYCEFKYARAGDRFDNEYIHQSAVGLMNANAKFSNCTFKDLDRGIAAHQNSNISVSNCDFTNTSGTPIAVSPSADFNFTGNKVTNVSVVALGLIGNEMLVSNTLKKKSFAGYDNITYSLQDNLTIKNGVSLTIEKGIVIKMEYKFITVKGGLKTNGTEDEPIILTAYKDDTYGNPFDTNGDGNGSAPAGGNWYGIEFDEESDDSFNTLNHTIIRFAGVGVSTTNASPTIQNSEISDGNSYGVSFNGNSAPIVSSTIIKNNGGHPIAMSLTSDPTFTDITFTANLSKAIRILEGTLSSDATLNKRNVAGITNIAYLVHSLTVSENATLTIAKGVNIKFDINVGGTHAIYIDGALIANGTAEERITFTSYKDDSVGGDSNDDGTETIPSLDWSGILFRANSVDAKNSMTYCDIKYCYGSFSSYQYGAVQFENAGGNIDNCRFQLVNYGVGARGSSNPSFTNNEFTNVDYNPIMMDVFSDPSFSGNIAQNVGNMSIGLTPQTFSLSETVPQRDFAGFNNISYYVYGGFTINNGVKLTIPSGTVFKVNYNGSVFKIKGELHSDGTADNPVVFTHINDDNYGNPMDSKADGNTTKPSIFSNNYYDPIIFDFEDVSDDNSMISHTILNYFNIAIECNSASPTISNSTFENDNNGIVLRGLSFPKVENNTFHDLTYCPIARSILSEATTSGNKMTGKTYKMINIISETLTQDVTLPKKNFGGINNIPYYFTTYTVGTGATLTLEKGLILKFSRSGWMKVQKGLIADGGDAADEKIIFTHIYDDFYGGDSNGDSTASTPTASYERFSGLYIEKEALDANVKLNNLIFRYAQYGLKINNSNPAVTKSSFSHSEYGSYIDGASNPTFANCDFEEITEEAIYNKDETFVIDAKNNWWGDNSGPEHTTNADGIGEKVSNAVDYKPWLVETVSPIWGDVSLNGFVQAYDASLILQHAVGNTTLNDKQLEVGDVSDNGEVSSLDASQILQFVVGAIDGFESAKARIENAYQEVIVADVVLSKDQDEITVPVTLSGIEFKSSFEVTIEYDATKYQFVELTSSSSAFKAVNSSVPGQVKVAVAGTESFGEDIVLTLKLKNLVTTERTDLVSITRAETDEQKIENVTNGSIEVTENSVLSIEGIYPSASSDQMNLVLSNSTSGKVNIQVISLNGITVYDNTLSSSKGTNYLAIDLNSTEGIYILQLSSDTGVARKKFTFYNR